MNQHFIDGSEAWNYGFIDSGTTFSYLPPKMWDQIMLHFDYFCEQTKNFKVNGQKKYCHGERFRSRSQGEIATCFRFDKTVWSGRHKEFLMGYPVINFYSYDIDD